MFDPLKYDRLHQQRIQHYVKQIDGIYRLAAKEAALMAAGLTKKYPEKVFTFNDFPQLKDRVDKMLAKAASDIQTVVKNGINKEWMAAEKKNDALVTSAYGNSGRKPPTVYMDRNLEGLDAFQSRKTGVLGLDLSDRVWNYTGQMKNEIEMALDQGIIEGKSAAELSRDVRKALKEPEKLFRRVRDTYGVLQLSKAAASYHPGRGVYRSSYKNAMRMTRTEINMAYRTADHLRWQNLNFVVGFEVRLSNNHPLVDICDDLKGRYPKTFKWVGWHPQCRCHVISILATEEELDKMDDAIWNDDDPFKVKSVNEVKNVPKGFEGWVQDNEERMKGWKSKPYFIKDNPNVINDILKGKGGISKPLTELTKSDTELIEQFIKEYYPEHIELHPPGDEYSELSIFEESEVKPIESQTLFDSFKKYLSEIATNESKALFNNLSDYEAVLLREYTDQLALIINRALIGSKNRIANFDKYKDVVEKGINSALDKLPSRPGKSIRDFNLKPDKLEFYKNNIGKEITENTFMSTTKKLFYNEQRNTRFVIIGKNGKDISSLSKIPSEQEVLFKSKTRFKIVKYEISNEKNIFYLEEI